MSSLDARWPELNSSTRQSLEIDFGNRQLFGLVAISHWRYRLCCGALQEGRLHRSAWVLQRDYSGYPSDTGDLEMYAFQACELLMKGTTSAWASPTDMVGVVEP